MQQWRKVTGEEFGYTSGVGEYPVAVPLFRKDGYKDSLDIDELLMYLNALESEVVYIFKELPGEGKGMEGLREVVESSPMETVKFLKALEKESAKNG